VKVRSPCPAFVQIEVFVETMPFFRVKLAGGKGNAAGTGFDGDICDDCPWVMSWKVVVDGGGQDRVGVVDDDCDEEAQASYTEKLDDCSDLDDDVLVLT